MSYAHEQEKIGERWPAAVRFIEERRLNEFIAGAPASTTSASSSRAAITTRVLRALERLGLADVYGRSQIPLYVHERRPIRWSRASCCASAPASARC